MDARLRGRSLLAASALLGVAGLFNDPPWKGYSPFRQAPVFGESAHIAFNLLNHGAFANPFAPLQTGPTAHVAPVFPFLQFVLLKIFGTGAAGWLALRCLPSLALSFQSALLPVIARTLGYSPWTGVFAAILGLIVKPGREELWEPHLSGLASLALTILFCRWRKTPDSIRLALGLGALAGFTFLIQPVIALVYLSWLAATGFRNPLGKNVALLWICPLVLCAPWIIRNYISLGSLFPIRDNLGLQLYVAYNDCAPYGTRESEARLCYTILHPNASLNEAKAVLDLGESQYNRDRLRRAMAWIAAHPRRAAILTLQHVWFFWFPSENGWEGYRAQRSRALLLHLLTLAGFAGLILSFRRKIPSAGILTSWTVLFPLIYYAVQFESRYRYPVLWITWLLAAYWIASGAAKSWPWLPARLASSQSKVSTTNPAASAKAVR